MHGPFPCRRHRIAVLAGLSRRAHTCCRSVAIQACAVEIALCEIVGRCNEIHKPFAGISAYIGNEIKFTISYRFDGLAVAAHTVKMSPAIALA